VDEPKANYRGSEGNPNRRRPSHGGLTNTNGDTTTTANKRQSDSPLPRAASVKLERRSRGRLLNASAALLVHNTTTTTSTSTTTTPSTTTSHSHEEETELHDGERDRKLLSLQDELLLAEDVDSQQQHVISHVSDRPPVIRISEPISDDAEYDLLSSDSPFHSQTHSPYSSNTSTNSNSPVNTNNTNQALGSSNRLDISCDASFDSSHSDREKENGDYDSDHSNNCSNNSSHVHSDSSVHEEFLETPEKEKYNTNDDNHFGDYALVVQTLSALPALLSLSSGDGDESRTNSNNLTLEDGDG
jgi:hypothetical protein